MKFQHKLDNLSDLGNLPLRFMQRELTPEILDSLPHDHPDAVHNRRDLRLTNRILGNHRWFVRTLPRILQPNEKVLELGAGTGELSRRLQDRRLNVDGLDLWPVPDRWPDKHAWHRADLLSFDHYSDYPVVIGNLIFHQFTPDQLAALGQKIRMSSRLIVACEPARRRSSQILFATIAPILGANHVSLHDAHVSVAAGFRTDELPRLLGLEPSRWQWRCETTLLGLYRMVAKRR